MQGENSADRRLRQSKISKKTAGPEANDVVDSQQMDIGDWEFGIDN